MSGSAYIGRLSKLYFNTGTFLAPVWLECKKIADVDIEDGSATSDHDTRESGNTKTVVGNSKFGIKFEYSVMRGVVDPVLAKIKDSRRAGDILDTLALDGPVGAGGEGIRGPFLVTSMNKKEPVNDQETYSIELAEGYDYDDAGVLIDTGAWPAVV